MKRCYFVSIVVIFTFANVQYVHARQGPKNLGLVGIKSAWGRYLQAHTDGELHASNERRNEEETWFLIEVDAQRHIYALQNWRTGNYMSKRVNGCAPAVASVISPAEEWRLESGRPYGVANAVILRCVADNTILGTNNPGNDSQCGGEITSRDVWGPGGYPIPVNNSSWGGWWVLESATQPSPGRDFWNTAGGVFNDIVVKVGPIALDALMAALSAG